MGERCQTYAADICQNLQMSDWIYKTRTREPSLCNVTHHDQSDVNLYTLHIGSRAPILAFGPLFFVTLAQNINQPTAQLYMYARILLPVFPPKYCFHYFPDTADICKTNHGYSLNYNRLHVHHQIKYMSLMIHSRWWVLPKISPTLIPCVIIEYRQSQARILQLAFPCRLRPGNTNFSDVLVEYWWLNNQSTYVFVLEGFIEVVPGVLSICSEIWIPPSNRGGHAGHAGFRTCVLCS